MIIKDFFVNLAILISLIFLYTQLTKSSPLNKTSPLTKKLIVGVIGGVLSNILMQFSIHIGITLVDLRHIPIILLSYYGGAIPAFISMVLVIIGRFAIGINTSSYAAVMLIILVTAAAIYLSNRNISKNIKIFLTLSFSNIIFSVMISFLLEDIKLLFMLIPSYWIITYFSGFVAFYMVKYLRTSQALFNRYKLESLTDSLTGLNNVRKFDEIFNSVLKSAESKQEMVSLLYIDIDFFKKVNDTYGHKEGDIVLKELGTILKNSTRSFDIVSRNGGEEFTVILLDCSMKRSFEISERIRKNVENHLFILSTGESIKITVSIGLASFNETTKVVTSLIEDADKALYQAKSTGRNKVCVPKLI